MGAEAPDPRAGTAAVAVPVDRPSVRGRSARTAVFLASRSLRRGNKGVLVLVAAMMALVYAQLLFIPALIQGAVSGIEEELRRTSTADVTVSPGGDDLAVERSAEVVSAIEAIDGVEAATAAVLAGTQVSHANRTGSWPVLAADPAGYRDVFITPERMIEGSFLEPGDLDLVVLGVGVAGADRTNDPGYRTSLQDVHVGDVVVITLVGGSTHEYEVKGIYEDELAQANLRAFVTVDDATAKVPALADRATSIGVLSDGRDVDALAADLAAAVPGVEVATWEELASALDEQVSSFELIERILGAVSLVVAAITVFIVTYVDLTSKRRTIGIERAVGITPAAITGGYVLRGVVFALVGVGLGASLMLGGVEPLLRQHPIPFPTGPVSLEVTGVELRRNALVLVVVAVAGAAVPSWQTVRTRLVDAIWG